MFYMHNDFAISVLSVWIEALQLLQDFTTLLNENAEGWNHILAAW